MSSVTTRNFPNQCKKNYEYDTQQLLIYLYFNTSGDSKKLVLDILKTSCEEAFDIIRRAEA